MDEAMSFFNTLEENTFAVDKSLTIADLLLVSTISTYDVMGYDLHPIRMLQSGSRRRTTLEEKFNKMEGTGIILHYHFASPPSRACVLLAKYLNMNIQLNFTDHLDGETKKPQFIEMNPLHQVPTLDDNGFYLAESRAILRYLQSEYDKERKLKPIDTKHSVLIDQRLYFDATILYPRVLDYFFPVFLNSEKPSEERANLVHEALELLDQIIVRSDWIAGDQISIADFSLIATVSTAEAVLFNIAKYPKVNIWYEKMKRHLKPFGYDESNKRGCDFINMTFKAQIKAQLKGY